MAIRIYSEHGEEREFDEPEFLTAIAHASRLIGKPPQTVLTRMRDRGGRRGRYEVSDRTLGCRVWIVDEARMVERHAAKLRRWLARTYVGPWVRSARGDGYVG
jgi:hypothetical protein